MSEHASPFRRLLSGLWRAVEVLRRILSTLFLLLMLALLLLVFAGPPAPTVPDNVALVWAPAGTLVETIDQPPEEALLQQLARTPPRQTLVRELVQTLERAAGDKRVRLVFLKLDQLDYAGMAQLQELGRAIAEFRKASGKKVIAYAANYTQEQYYLAAQADEVYMDPMGVLLVSGFGLYNQYFKEALDKLGVDMHVFRAGEYKSAVEPFERVDMSPEARAANVAWLSVLWEHYKSGVASPRKLQPEAIEHYAANYPALMEIHSGDTAQIAKASGLVDGLLTLEQLRAQVGTVVGMDDDIGSFRQIDHYHYLAAAGADPESPEDAPSVALVVAQGELIDGESVMGATGGDTLAELIRQAIDDSQVAALLLRVDSPGGSISASETIRRQIQRFRETGRPVVVSMSALAASGGYWIAVDADEIWAQETTLTGSIGVFGLVPTYDRTLAKLGIRTDGVGTTPMVAALRLDRPMTPEVQRAIQLLVEKDYRQFLQQVARGREMQPEAVDRIARGRVWSGQDARKLGLVDQIGGQQQAVVAAAKLAGLGAGEYRLQPIELHRDFTTSLLERFSLGLARVRLPLPAWLEKTVTDSDWQRGLRWLNDPRSVYAHCFCRPAAGLRLH